MPNCGINVRANDFAAESLIGWVVDILSVLRLHPVLSASFNCSAMITFLLKTWF